jgi:hypothetical protein
MPPEGLTADDVERMSGRPYPRNPEDRPSIPDWDPWSHRFDRDGMSVSILGIRASESLTRLKAVSHATDENWVVRVNRFLHKGYPIYDMNTWDIWTTIKEAGWDYNEAYDVMDMAGIPAAESRCAPPFGEEPIGGLWMFAEAFPDIWAKMCERVPGAAAAARYARTELYNFGKLGVAKPDDVPWPEFIAQLVSRWDDTEKSVKLTAQQYCTPRFFVANQIKTYIGRHHKYANSPIVGNNLHPQTGLSWTWLRNIAIRGNFKGRRQPMTHVSPWEPYINEFRAMKELGRLWEIGLPESTPEPKWPEDAQIDQSQLIKVRYT